MTRVRMSLVRTLPRAARFALAVCVGVGGFVPAARAAQAVADDVQAHAAPTDAADSTAATAVASDQARSTTADTTPARVRVRAARATLLATCWAFATVRSTLTRGDELEVVRKVDANWYRVRLPGSGGVEGCIAATAVEPIVGPSSSSSSSRPTRSGGSPGGAQPKPAGAGPGAKGGRPKWFGVSGFVNVGETFFTASDSFDAILNTSSGAMFGGGGQVQLPYHLFARVDFSRFRKDGERAFVSGAQVFKLGIPTTITVTPIELTGGYRRALLVGGRPRKPPVRGGRTAPTGPPRRGFRLIPYAGAGVGSVQYKETASFAQAGDDVDERFTSYHVLGGVEVPVWRWVGVGVEYQHRWVPDALGASGVSAEFHETDLGGGTFRVRFIVSF